MFNNTRHSRVVQNVMTIFGKTDVLFVIIKAVFCFQVWIHRGHVHIIPEIVGKNANESNEKDDLSVDEALAWLAKDPSFTIASQPIQEQIQRRIAG